MRSVRDRAEARWLPSRFDFALFRLFAYIRLKRSRPEPKPGLVLAIQRHQGAIEAYLICILVFVVLASFVASLLATMMPFGAACALALPVAAVYINAQIVFTGAIIAPIVRKIIRTDREIGIVVNATLWTIVIVGAACLLAVSESPLRHVGTFFLAAIAANAIASLIVFSMQRSFVELERRYGVEP